jgi:peptidoglycan/LPS O-acetylase OafA/YrhL
MIQRIQHLWLFLASLVSAGQFLTNIYHDDSPWILSVGNDYSLLLLTVLLIGLPLVTIFMYKNRATQRNLVWLTIFINAAFVALMLFWVSRHNEGTSAPQNGTYWIGSVLPIMSFIMLIAALRGIRKDEKIIKSLDRLR